jgi:hypothetical protein
MRAEPREQGWWLRTRTKPGEGGVVQLQSRTNDRKTRKKKKKEKPGRPSGGDGALRRDRDDVHAEDVADRCPVSFLLREALFGFV